MPAKIDKVAQPKPKQKSVAQPKAKVYAQSNKSVAQPKPKANKSVKQKLREGLHTKTQQHAQAKFAAEREFNGVYLELLTLINLY